MIRILAACLCALLTFGVAPPASAHQAPMRITGFTVRPRAVSPHGTLIFTVHAQGLTLDLVHLGKQNVARHGHFQYYLDRIPRDAWTRVDLHHSYIDAAATTKLYIAVRASATRIGRGRHRILVALARNDRTLYHVPARSVMITVT
jgi:hypothetical protein